MSKNKQNKALKYIKSIPWYGWFFGALMLGIQGIFHASAWAIASKLTSKWFFVDPQIPSIDNYIPMIPYVFVQLYGLWFPCVVLGGIVAGRQKKKEWLDFMLSWLIAILVGFLIFVFCPSRISKIDCAGVPGGNIHEYLANKKGWSWTLVKTLHVEDYNWNLFPSFHCLNIIFCYLGVARRKDVNLVHRIGQLMITILICMSTVFVKNHYFIDIIIALALSLVCFVLVKSFSPAKKILEKCPNFLIIKKLNWAHEEIVPLDKENKKDVKIEKVG